MSNILGGLGALGDIAVNTISSGIGGLMSNSFSKKLMNFQSEKSLYNQSQLNMRQYPQMVASMRAAGLNPAMITSPGSAQTASMPSAQTPVSMKGISANEIAQLSLLDAQKRNLDADTKQKLSSSNKLDFEATHIDNENFIQFERWAAELANMNSSTFKNYAEAGLSEAYTQKAYKEIEYLGVAENELMSKIELNFSNIRWNEKQISQYDNYIRSVIANNFANATYMSNEDKRQGELLLYKQFNYSAMTRMYNSQSDVNKSQFGVNNANKDLLQTNKQLQDWSLKMQKRYGDVQNCVGIATDVVKTAASCFSAGGMLMMGLNGFGKHASSSLSPLSVPTFNANPSNRTFEYLGKHYRY